MHRTYGGGNWREMGYSVCRRGLGYGVEWRRMFGVGCVSMRRKIRCEFVPMRI